MIVSIGILITIFLPFYGGFINVPSTELVTRVLKSGIVRQREVKSIAQITFPRLIAPLPGTEGVDTKDMTDGDIQYQNVQLKAKRKPQI